jgi:energy-coupling factor transporter transmembrane protein EcfT
VWILSFIPDSFLLYIVNAILIAGAIGTFFTFFILHRVVRWLPSLAPYHLLLQIVSIVLLVAGVYFKGGYGVEMEWREKVRIAQEKAAIAEAQAKDLNTKLNAEIKKKQKVIVENRVVYRDRIKEVEKIIDAKCEIAPEAVDIHNAAAKNRLPGEKK